MTSLPALRTSDLDEVPLDRCEPHLTGGVHDPLAVQVDPEIRRVDDRRLLDRCRPPEGGTQPGEELVHPERLRDVVVGAGVERGHLLRLRLPGRQDDDRRCVQPRRPLMTSRPLMPGSPRSRITASGGCRAASSSAASPVVARSTS